MAVIVLHKETNIKYILLGTGFGAFKATRPSFFLGNLAPHEEEGEMKMAAVCDENGEIYWCASEALKVLEIDGLKVEDFFHKKL